MPGFPSPEPRARRARLISGAALAMAAVAVTACLAQTAGIARADTTSGTARTRTVRTDAAESKVQTSITWGACPPLAAGATRNPAQKCGTVTVPLDYRHPAGKTITIEVSELATAKPGKKHGYLLLNPGGPALEGLDMPSTMAPTLPASVLDEYDLIGFDPRGVGVSTPMSCGLSEGFGGLFPYPAANGSITQNIAQAKAAAKDCAKIGDELQYFTTANTARDMNRIRQALGVQKISYWGQSYGTYLGAVYTTLFPQNTGRMILEGAIDPNDVWQNQIELWNQGMNERFPDAARIAAADNAQLGLGSTIPQVTRTFLALASRLDKAPVTIPGANVSLNGALLREVTYELLLHNTMLTTLTQFWKASADLSAGKTLTAADAAALQQAFADLNTPGPVSANVPADNQASMTLALICGDASWPRNIASYAAATAAARARYPLSDGMPDNVWPCAFWSKAPIEPPVRVTSHGPRDILILQNRRDNATPWAGALGMAEALGRRAAFVGVDNGGHYVYGTGSSCADQATVAFLVNGTLPAKPVYCPAPTS
jgi:pimeloyl-ACP methyl ester carboxylesterase